VYRLSSPLLGTEITPVKVVPPATFYTKISQYTNEIEKIPENKLFDVHEFYHPIYNNDAIIGSQELEKIQGLNYTWFCGAYLRYGFHEDGIASAVNLLNKMDQKK
jgi:predicted NAD/FAD-binding protein